MQTLDSQTEKQAIIDKIKAYETIIIHRHQRPDPDAIGSQTGLRALIQQAYPEKKVYAVGEDIGDLVFLSQNDVIVDDLYKGALVIVTDTANEKRISDGRYRLGDALIKIDHHPRNDDGQYADLTWADDTFSSCSEMIGELSFDFPDDLPMNDEAARVLYAGMVADTNRFLYDATTRHTMEIAGRLMEYDFDHTALNDVMNRLEPNEAKLIGYTLNNLSLLPSGAAYIFLSAQVLDELGLTSKETGAVVALPRNITGVEAWIIFVEEPSGIYRARIRSKGPYINGLAEAYGGGGHRLASGAYAHSDEDAKQMIGELEALVENYNVE